MTVKGTSIQFLEHVNEILTKSAILYRWHY